jgi:hypothetical protein
MMTWPEAIVQSVNLVVNATSLVALAYIAGKIKNGT